MTSMALLACCAVVCFGARGIGADPQANAEPKKHRECSDGTLKGTYGVQIQGTRPITPGTMQPTESVIGVVIRTYDGAGSFTQVDNVKGSVSGIPVPDRPGFGTYEVREDCTAIATAQPGPGIVLEERLVIVDDGEEIRGITSSPLPVMVTSVSRRIDTR
jgi:hypothetical protein